MKSRIGLLNKIALGTAQFGLDYGISNHLGKTGASEAGKILQFAWDKGIRTLDTARAYGDSEIVIGQQAKKSFQIVTKFAADTRSTNELRLSLINSLKALRAKDVYGLLAHDAELLKQMPWLWEKMQHLKNETVVQKIGYSLYLPSQLEELLSMGIVPDIVQLPFSFFDRRFQAYFSELKLRKVEVHVRSIFLQGLFFKDPDELGNYFLSVKPLIRRLHSCFDNKKDLAAWLLQFVLDKKDVDKVIIGVNNLEQLKENLSGVTKLHSIAMDEPDISEDILLPYLWPK